MFQGNPFFIFVIYNVIYMLSFTSPFPNFFYIICCVPFLFFRWFKVIFINGLVTVAFIREIFNGLFDLRFRIHSLQLEYDLIDTGAFLQIGERLDGIRYVFIDASTSSTWCYRRALGSIVHIETTVLWHGVILLYTLSCLLLTVFERVKWVLMASKKW